MTKKSERAELEEAIAHYNVVAGAHPLAALLDAARKHLATLPPDPAPAPTLYAVINRFGELYSAEVTPTADRAERKLQDADQRGYYAPYRLVTYKPVED